MPEQPSVTRPSPVDRVRQLIDQHAETCLADLAAHAPDAPTPESCVHRAGAWSILLAVFPTPADQRLLKLRDCDRDCLSLLAMYDIPLPAEKMRDLLEGRGIGI